jgi:hypothetical protein
VKNREALPDGRPRTNDPVPLRIATLLWAPLGDCSWMGCLQMSTQMHRKCENSRTLGAREGSESVVIFLGLGFDLREP